MDEELIEKIDGLDGTGEYVKEALKTAVREGGTRAGLRGTQTTYTRPRCVIEIEEFIGEWNMRQYSAESVGVAFSAGSEWRLTPSETKWVAHAVDRGMYTYDEIERAESPDFIVLDDIGIEVKSERNYSISRKQLKAIRDLEIGHVYLSTERNIELLDTFDWIGMNEYIFGR
jgi:hypothetical protein